MARSGLGCSAGLIFALEPALPLPWTPHSVQLAWLPALTERLLLLSLEQPCQAGAACLRGWHASGRVPMPAANKGDKPSLRKLSAASSHNHVRTDEELCHSGVMVTQES